MNKKFLSAILFGALMVTSTGTFVSCKDYDEDIDSINKELTDIKSQLAALQTKVDAGKWITGVTTTANGVAITMSDGQTLNITNGKDGQNGAAGAQGEAGKDGKDGSVVEVKDGVLCINGVATEIKVAKEAPAALPCVKVEDGKLMVLGADGKYAATGIEAGAVTAAKTNGVWTITVDGEEIVVPGSAALTSIAIQGKNTLVYTYGIVKKATPWGWTADGGKTYDEEMEAGFYSRLSEDVDVLLNPAEADATAFTYTFRNSVKAVEGITFFGEARPSTTVLTRATSANGVWTLPAVVTKHAATSISELRNELYLNFKQNDKEYYAMSLEAVDGLGNVSTRSDYEYKITLDQAAGTPAVEGMNCLVGQEYYPSVTGPVFDYKIRIKPTVANKRKAEAFGVEVTEDEKGFIATKDAAIFNDIQFQVAYVTISGGIGTLEFTADFANEFTSSEEVRIEEIKKPLNATLVVDENGDPVSPKQFVIKNTYSLADMYANLSEEVQLILEEQFKAEEDLIGGEAGAGENYNELNRNTDVLLKNIDWSYNPAKKEITVFYYVSAEWPQPEAPNALAALSAREWDVYSNFQLNTAYQLNLTVLDGLNGSEVAKFELPFEFEDPTEEIARIDGRFSKWSTIPVEYKANGDVKRSEPALYVYGVMKSENDNAMALPLYDAFDAWKPETAKRAEYEESVDDAEYYDLFFNVTGNSEILGYENSDVKIATDLTSLDYNAEYAELSTFANDALIKHYSARTNADGTQKEFYTPIHADYKYYGVYAKWNTSVWEDNYNLADTKITDENVWNTENMAAGDFNLVFASWLKHSTLKMKETSYTAAAGTHTVFISNEDLNFTTPKGDAFYLFDGISTSGKVVERADLNINAFNEIEQHPFTTVDDLFATANFSVKQAAGDKLPVEHRIGQTALGLTYDDETGKAEINLDNLSVEDKQVRIYNIPAVAKSGDKTTGFKQAFAGGMLIALPTSIQDGQSVIVTVTLTDNWGYTNSFDIKVKKLN